MRETDMRRRLGRRGSLYESIEGGAVRCRACGHECLIPEGGEGICRMRINIGGELIVPRGYVSGLAIDPIEKKPFFHVMPGEPALSYGMPGCSMRCEFCQNWHSSQAFKDPRASVEVRRIEPEDLIAVMKREEIPIIVSTYNEPIITAEWSKEIFDLARSEGFTTGFVSNGFASPYLLDYMGDSLEIMNIDLKAFSDATYRHLGGRLDPVLATIKEAHGRGIWVEIITLIVPGMNDSREELLAIADFIASVSSEIPWHITGFHPAYRMRGGEWTKPEVLLRGCEIGREAGLSFVYTGNRPGMTAESESTFCPSCGERAIVRRGFEVMENRLIGGTCRACGHLLEGRWEAGSSGGE